MDKSLIPFVLLGCVLLVFGMKMFSGMLFVWWEEKFTGKKEKSFDDKALDDLIESRKLTMRRSDPVTLDEANKSSKGHSKSQANAKLLAEDTDPESLKRKAILHQIYDLKVQRIKDEPDSDYYARILSLPKAATADSIKKAYKEKALACHPDRFDFSTFDAKTKEKLKSKVHENFLVIQKAYDYFKKAA